MRIEPTADATLAVGDAVGAPPNVRDEFLRLLVAQLAHQNPLEPQDGAEFIAQLAQFTSVEQGARTNDLLSSLGADQSVASGAGMAAFVGKQATVGAEAVRWSPDQGEPPELVVDVTHTASSLTVEIVDESGEVVKTFELGPQARGTATVPWDGTDAQGRPLAAGTYQFRTRVESSGDSATASIQLRGTVEAIEFDGGQARVRIGAASVSPPSIMSIGQ